jgi:hypothetical protein
MALPVFKRAATIYYGSFSLVYNMLTAYVVYVDDKQPFVFSHHKFISLS